MAETQRQIIHLDMDAFFASVEIHDQPELAGKPVIVGGLSRRGVVSAASYQARRYGIHSAMPMALARKRCPQGIFLPVRMERYQEVSARIMVIFRCFTPLVEPVSLDEAFLDVTASRMLMGDGVRIARDIKARVQAETGLTVSAGVASSKLVAKIASDQDKPDGLTVVAAGEEQRFLAGLPIERLWGVGKTTRDKLALMGVRTIGELARLPPSLLTAAFGKHGQQMHLAGRGVDHRPVVPERPTKSIGHEDTYERDLLHRHDLERELLQLTVRVARRLRRHGLAGATITVKVKYYDFRQVTRSRTLATATCDEGELFAQARELLAKTEAGRKPVRLLGVAVSSLRSLEAMRQLAFFQDPRQAARKRHLHAALDAISERYGGRAIGPARLLADSGKDDRY